MLSINKTLFSGEPSEGLLKQLTLRLLDKKEFKQADSLFEREHYLGPVKRTGKGLMQVIEYEGQVVALLDWGPAALKLLDRDQWIVWNARQRADRRDLIVQNRRFLLPLQTRMANLASRCLSLALKALPAQRQQAYGLKPLLAETFTDIEQFEGTCYKASNWIALGQTKGFKGHRADYYQYHARPKKLWVYPLHSQACELLQSICLPEAYAKAINSHSPERDLPLKAAQVHSLRQALAKVPDPRKSNRSFPIGSLLSLVAMGLLAGCTNLAQIQRYGQFLTHAQRVWLDWPPKKNSKGRKAPSYQALYNLLCKIDPHAYAKEVSKSMKTHLGTLPRALALDGKYIHDQVLTLCLSDHDSGAPAAMALADPKPRSEDNKTDGELTVSKKLYQNTELHDAVVTADALHDKQSIAQAIVEQGGDLFATEQRCPPLTDENSRKVGQRLPPFFTRSLDKGHGRIEDRHIKVYRVEPTEVQLAHARSLIIVHKTTTRQSEEKEVHSRHVYLSSLPPGKGCAETFATLIRGHWGGCENRNHWIRDHLFREDDTRSKNWNLNANLAVTRSALLNLKARILPEKSWAEIRQTAQYKIGFASKLIGKRPPK